MQHFYSFLCFAFLFAQSLSSQIPSSWDPVGALPGVTGGSSISNFVNAMVIDDDGNIFIAGDFEIAGGVMAHRIVKYDGAEFYPIAESINGVIEDLAIDGTGNLYAGGSFSEINGLEMNRVAKWDGTDWSSLGDGVGNNTVYALTVAGPDEVYVGGDFTTAGGEDANRVAIWNGSYWAPIGDGFDFLVRALILCSNGTLYAGGEFNESGSTDVSRVAYWDGTSWKPMGTGTNNSVLALEADDSGNVYVGGDFTSAGGKNYYRIAKWDGSAWSGAGGGEYVGFDARVHDLFFDDGGSLYACGSFSSFSSTELSGAAVLSLNETWQSIGSQFTTNVYDYRIRSILRVGTGDVFVGGFFDGADGLGVRHIARWDGTRFHALQGGPDSSINASEFDQEGNLYVAGLFTSAGGEMVNRIALWDGTEYLPMGEGFNASVNDITIDSNGILYACGNFTKSGATEIKRVARWSGAEWEPLGDGINREVNVIATNSLDELIAGGSYFTEAGNASVNNIAKWDGNQWHDLDGGVNGAVNSLLFDDQDNLYIGGSFTEAGNSSVSASRIAKWDGIEWTALGDGVNGSVKKIIKDEDGELIVAGDFTNAGGITVRYLAYWNGTSWSGIGDYTDSYLDDDVLDIALDAYGNLYAGGFFTNAGGHTVNLFARWDGDAWNSLDNGFNNITDGMPSVRTFSISNDGILFAGGTFLLSGEDDRVTPFLARTILPGQVTIDIEPLDAVNEGARWSYDGGNTWLEPGTYELPEGNYSISFNEVSGWIKPEEKTVNSAYGTKPELTGEYGIATRLPSDPENEAYITVYPVPATDWINIDIPGNGGVLSIIDMKGAIVMEKKTINKTREKLFIGDLRPGMYLARLMVDDRMVFHKIIVE
ncbi:MAG: T9SS type A sorting domain-containing protein [Marinilabilia sp.]